MDESLVNHYKHVGKTAARWATGGAIAAALLYGLFVPTSLMMIMAAVGLVSIGSGVTGALLTLSFEHDEHEPE